MRPRSPGAVLQRGEAGLAHHALEHQPAGHRHRDRLRLELLVRHLAVAVVQVGRMVVGLKSLGKATPWRAQRGQLLAPFGDQLVVVRASSGAAAAAARGCMVAAGCQSGAADCRWRRPCRGRRLRSAGRQSASWHAPRLHHAHPRPHHRPPAALCPGGLRPHRAEPPRRPRRHAGAGRAGGGVRHRPRGAGCRGARDPAPRLRLADRAARRQRTPTAWCWPRPAACTRSRRSRSPRPASTC